MMDSWNDGSLIDVAFINPADDVDTLKRKLDGVVLYDHIYSGAACGGETKAVTIKELETMGVIQSVTLHTKIV